MLPSPPPCPLRLRSSVGSEPFDFAFGYASFDFAFGYAQDRRSDSEVEERSGRTRG